MSDYAGFNDLQFHHQNGREGHVTVREVYSSSWNLHKNILPRPLASVRNLHRIHVDRGLQHRREGVQKGPEDYVAVVFTHFRNSSRVDHLHGRLGVRNCIYLHFAKITGEMSIWGLIGNPFNGPLVLASGVY